MSHGRLITKKEDRPVTQLTSYHTHHPPQLLCLRKNCTRDRPSPSYARHMAVQPGCLVCSKAEHLACTAPPHCSGERETPVPFHSLLQLSAITSHHYLLQGTQFSLREKKKKNQQKVKPATIRCCDLPESITEIPQENVFGPADSNCRSE